MLHHLYHSTHTAVCHPLLQGKLLGVGGYGAANLAKFQGGYVAFKSIPEPQPIAGTYGKTELSDLHNRKILNEAAPLLRLRHARIVQLVGVVLEGDSRGLVMEYLPTTLEKWLKRQRLQVSCWYAGNESTVQGSCTP